MRGSVNEMVCARAYWGSSAVAMAPGQAGVLQAVSGVRPRMMSAMRSAIMMTTALMLPPMAYTWRP